MPLAARMGSVPAGLGRPFSWPFGADHGLHLVLAAIVLPLQRLQVAQIISAPLPGRYDMVYLPPVPAPRVAIVLADDRPTPSIHPQSGVCSQAPCLLPDRFNEFSRKRSSLCVSVRFSVHDLPHATALSVPTTAGPDPDSERGAPAPTLHRHSKTRAGTVLNPRLKGSNHASQGTLFQCQTLRKSLP